MPIAPYPLPGYATESDASTRVLCVCVGLYLDLPESAVHYLNSGRYSASVGGRIWFLAVVLCQFMCVTNSRVFYCCIVSCKRDSRVRAGLGPLTLATPGEICIDDHAVLYDLMFTYMAGWCSTLAPVGPVLATRTTETSLPPDEPLAFGVAGGNTNAEEVSLPRCRTGVQCNCRGGCM